MGGTIAFNFFCNGFAATGPSALNFFSQIDHWQRWFFNGFSNWRATMVMTQERRPKKARDDKLSHFNKMKIDHDEERIAMKGFSICKMKIFTVDCLTFAQFLIPFADPLVCNNTSTALAAPLLLAGRRNEHWPLSSFRPACCRLCAAPLAPAPRLAQRQRAEAESIVLLQENQAVTVSQFERNYNKTTH